MFQNQSTYVQYARNVKDLNPNLESAKNLAVVISTTNATNTLALLAQVKGFHWAFTIYNLEIANFFPLFFFRPHGRNYYRGISTLRDNIQFFCTVPSLAPFVHGQKYRV